MLACIDARRTLSPSWPPPQDSLPEPLDGCWYFTRPDPRAGGQQAAYLRLERDGATETALLDHDVITQDAAAVGQALGVTLGGYVGGGAWSGVVGW